jgi:hypothetical protein
MRPSVHGAPPPSAPGIAPPDVARRDSSSVSCGAEASARNRRAVAADLKRIYTATDRDHAEAELDRFAEKCDQRYPMISASWI